MGEDATAARPQLYGVSASRPFADRAAPSAADRPLTCPVPLGDHGDVDGVALPDLHRSVRRGTAGLAFAFGVAAGRPGVLAAEVCGGGPRVVEEVVAGFLGGPVAAFHLVDDLQFGAAVGGGVAAGPLVVVVGQVEVAGPAQQPVGQDHWVVAGVDPVAAAAGVRAHLPPR